MGINRREVMKAGATYGALASLFGAVPVGVRAQDSAAGTNCLTILYPAGDGITFDGNYYRDKHLTLIMDLYSKSIERFELRTVPKAPEGRPAMAYSAVINIWITDLEAFRDNTVKHTRTMVDDVPNFTNSRPTIQYDKVHGESGAARSTPKIGDTCLSIFYPNEDGVRWEVDKYRTGHLPLIMNLYGTEAIKRFELRKGETGGQPGSKPGFIGTVNIYINDQKKFDAAGAQHGQTLVKDVPNFSSVMPSAFPSIIHGLG